MIATERDTRQRPLQESETRVAEIARGALVVEPRNLLRLVVGVVVVDRFQAHLVFGGELRGKIDQTPPDGGDFGPLSVVVETKVVCSVSDAEEWKPLLLLPVGRTMRVAAGDKESDREAGIVLVADRNVE